MMLIPADAFDVIPRGRLMAEETLADLSLFHACDAHRNHLEVHHVVAGRSLMALSTGLRGGRRVLELRNGPSRRAMA